METFLIKALQLILSLSILVVIHEFGHFLFARIFKIRVEKFYLFFNPWFSLFKYKPKNSDTEYGIGWLPLGGYVKISGMIDESMDKEQMAQPAQPWEFRSKPAWQRLLVMVGGVLFNFILAMVVYSMMLFAWGDTYVPLKNMTYGMAFSDAVKAGGFQDKDILISADGEDLVLRGSVMDMNTLIHFVDAKKVLIERDGKQMEIQPPVDFAEKVIAARELPYEPWLPVTIKAVRDSSEAKKAGLQAGDSIVSINSVPVSSLRGIRKEIGGNLNKSIPLTYYRNGEELSTTLKIDSTGIIGIESVNLAKDYKIQEDKYGFFASFPRGIKLGVQTLNAYIAQTRFIFSKEGVSNLSGFGGIGNMFPAEWNWQAFWTMTAFLSIVLAFMNILPIPALDGGHIMFLLYEVITRREPNQKFMEYAQIGGMILLIGLLLVANGNDIIRFFFK